MLFSDGDKKLTDKELQIAIKYMNSLEYSYENIDIGEDEGDEDDK